MAIKIGMVSLGCSKNRVDAEIMMGRLKQAGYAFVEEAGMADVAIVNTCGFIEDAKKEAIEEILELVQLKKEKRIRAIIVTGCLAQRYREEVAKEIPEVDAVIGIGANASITEVVEKALRQEKRFLSPRGKSFPCAGSACRQRRIIRRTSKLPRGATIAAPIAPFLPFAGVFAAGRWKKLRKRRAVWRKTGLES